MIERLRAYRRRGESLRPDLIARAAARVLRRESRLWLSRRRDAVRSTYWSWPSSACPSLEPALSEGSIRVSAVVLDACERYLTHHFDLLGSGWVHVRHGMTCDGFAGVAYPPAKTPVVDRDGDWLRDRINGANVREARRIWGLVDPGYLPIDWHIDFKSGFRWSESTWYADVSYGGQHGVDVKVPWEIGRMQHLPQLALAFQATGDSRWVREIRNEILDFLATNPPRYGVQWRSTMDVGIRIANWLVAWNLCRAAGGTFDDAFEAVLARSTFEHGQHIVANLEWYPTHRGNHYLANVVGLLFAAAHLPRSRLADAWLSFAARELVSEATFQFAVDGSNFEASSCYHRLSAEMLVYGAALLLGCDEERWEMARTATIAGLPIPDDLRRAHDSATERGAMPIPDWLLERLERAGEMAWRLRKPTGRVVQIGDNDSGRFLKLEPAFTDAPCNARPDSSTFSRQPTGQIVEDQLDHRHLIGAIGALCGRLDLQEVGLPFGADAACVMDLARLDGVRQGRNLGTAAADLVRVGDVSTLTASIRQIREDAADVLRQELPLPFRVVLEEVVAAGYPDFGVYVLRLPRLFASIRCGPVGQSGYGGHAHNDQLALELTIDGEDRLADPGSFVYTPWPERRNAYRSVRAHAAPRIAGVEPGELGDGLFLLRERACAECLYFAPDGFLGRHVGYGVPLYRHLELDEDRLIVTDYLMPDGSNQRLDRAAALDCWVAAVPFSPAYGVVCE